MAERERLQVEGRIVAELVDTASGAEVVGLPLMGVRTGRSLRLGPTGAGIIIGSGFFFPNEMSPAGAGRNAFSGSALNVPRQETAQK
jgi:hypothetical protein